MSENLHVEAAQKTDPGMKRENNEDYVTFWEPVDLRELSTSGRLYILADGVGGAAKGEKASQYAAQKVLYDYYRNPQIPPAERLDALMQQANADIFQYTSERYERMATTMVAAIILKDRLIVANVGDSRAYLIRNGMARQITSDHNYVGERVRSGELTEEEALYSKGKNRLTRSLGGEPSVSVDIFPNIGLMPNDKILLCSDGLTRYATSQDVARLVSIPGQPHEIVEKIIEFANLRGGADNVSVTLIEVGQPIDNEITVKRQPRGQTPVPVDWDTMSGDKSSKSAGGRSKGRGKNNSIPLIIGGLLLILAVLLVIIFLLLKPYLDQQEKAVDSEPAIAQAEDIDVLPLTETANFTQTASPTATDVFTATPTVTLTAMGTPTQIPSEISTNTPVGTEIPVTPEGQVSEVIQDPAVVPVMDPASFVCLKEASSAGLINLLGSFGVPYGAAETYYYYSECTPNSYEPVIECGEQSIIMDHSDLKTNWYVVIPGVDMATCTGVDGAYYFYKK